LQEAASRQNPAYRPASEIKRCHPFREASFA